MASWNINGVRSKLENDRVQALLLKYDLIGLNEVKTKAKVSLPGYVSFKSDNCEHNRGGTVVLIRRRVMDSVVSIDTTMKDQVWVRLSALGNIIIGICYIPPSDSQYFNPYSFSFIQEKLRKSEEEGLKTIILGDMNSRFGTSVRNLPMRAGIPYCDMYSYPVIPDLVDRPSHNADILADVCVDNKLLIVNNLRYMNRCYESALTYKAGNRWISELDICCVSHEIIECVSSFDVMCDACLPSDHALIAIGVKPPLVDRVSLLERATQLGVSAEQCLYQHNYVRSLKFENVDLECLKSELSRCEIPRLTNNIDTDTEEITDILYRCADSSRRVAAPIQDYDCRQRWERLVNDSNDKRVWAAIDWRGEYIENRNAEVRPSSEDFRAYYDEVYNPEGSTAPDPNQCQSDVFIPVLDEPVEVGEVITQMNNMKPNKSCGPDGVSPGVVKYLPGQWILALTEMFNSILASATYPSSWRLARMFNIYKKGYRKEASNYRGINVINSVAKLFDSILSSPLNNWFAPSREQAGSQSGRGCTEHIVTLLLIVDLAKRKKLKLFVTFLILEWLMTGSPVMCYL